MSENKPSLWALRQAKTIESVVLFTSNVLFRDSAIHDLALALDAARAQGREDAAVLVDNIEAQLPDRVRNAQYLRGVIAAAIRALPEGGDA